ncbi:hypothetical protein GCM10009030_23650 [Haloarcula pellucida]|uniref:Uncharacterized protein n=1 Tax=Haloarcula pellucida TaxID=1427151 RepID=A0A830GLS8_9EURY|nr:hypothetical protein GCM10009030_23650 [Halomicroarcula pellucida]
MTLSADTLERRRGMADLPRNRTDGLVATVAVTAFVLTLGDDAPATVFWTSRLRAGTRRKTVGTSASVCGATLGVSLRFAPL